MQVVIAAARPADREHVLRLVSESGLPLDGLAEHLESAIVARIDDRVVGCAALEIYPDGVLLRSVAVAPSSRSCGIGRQLAQAALEAARRAGATDVYLLTTTAERFFSQIGFSTIERAVAPAGLQTSVEFQSACPASATLMRRSLAGVA